MRRKAFTFLELLVAAGIISAVAAIMLPSIGKARSVARRTTCAARLRVLVLGTTLYTQEDNGWLPPGPREVAPDGRFENDPDRGSPIELFSALRITRTDLSSQRGWYGQGLLWRQGGVAEPRAFYCPEMDRRGFGFATAWPQRLDLAPDQAGEKSCVNSSYLYRGGYASAAGGSDGPLSLWHNAPGEPLFADTPFFGTMVHPGGYTIAFLGGHVEFHTAPRPVTAGMQVSPLWDAARQAAPATAPRP